MTAELETVAIGGFGRRYPTMVIGGALLGLVVLASLLAPALTSYDPLKPSFSQRLAPPWGLGGTRGHVLGTDNLGRDILARLLYGGRISLALAVSAVLIAAVAGVLVGLVASWGGGRADAVIMRVADVQLAFPVIMLAIAPSHDFFGLTRGASLCLPNRLPTKYAPVSPTQLSISPYISQCGLISCSGRAHFQDPKM